MAPAIWWIRRDVRLEDNPALQAALQAAGQVIPVFVLDPVLLARPAPRRQGFLFAALADLDASLRRRGSALVVRSGAPGEVLGALLSESGAQAIYAGEDFSPYARRRDASMARDLPLRLLTGASIRHPQAALRPGGRPYTVFTPYSKAWKALTLTGGDLDLDLSPAPEALPAFDSLAGEPIPAPAIPAGDFPAQEAEAVRRLDRFCAGPIYAYSQDRDRLDLPGTSALSPYLRFGLLSPRRALAAAWQARQAAPDPQAVRGVDSWINELVWRDFYTAILFHFPEVLRREMNPALRSIAWREDSAELRLWQQGLTGYPVVDAAMRQLAQTGWMHNRARMIVASFLVKDLLIDWRSGERWFMEALVDGDPAANNGGWQWSAGVGADAAPYFRVFNPVLQGQKFDPHGAFARRWLPELERLPAAWIHRPWEMPAEACRACGFRPGQDYPLPIVDHAFARRRALAAYRRSSPDGERSGPSGPASIP